jgi:hypothetical protein
LTSESTEPTHFTLLAQLTLLTLLTLLILLALLSLISILTLLTSDVRYYLNNKLPWEIKPIGGFPEHANKTMEVTNMIINNMGHENALTFDRPLAPSNGFEAIVPGDPTTILFAVGNVPNPVDQYFGYVSCFVTLL